MWWKSPEPWKWLASVIWLWKKKKWMKKMKKKCDAWMNWSMHCDSALWLTLTVICHATMMSGVLWCVVWVVGMVEPLIGLACVICFGFGKNKSLNEKNLKKMMYERFIAHTALVLCCLFRRAGAMLRLLSDVWWVVDSGGNRWSHGNDWLPTLTPLQR